MTSLEERLDRDGYPEAWRPATGDKLVGTIVELDERESTFGESSYPIVTVERDGGQQLAFHAYHTVARSELAKQRPQIGERIGIAYHGRHPEPDYERYRIIIERQDSAPDWDAIGARAEAEASQLAHRPLGDGEAA